MNSERWSSKCRPFFFTGDQQSADSVSPMFDQIGKTGDLGADQDETS